MAKPNRKQMISEIVSLVKSVGTIESMFDSTIAEVYVSRFGWCEVTMFNDEEEGDEFVVTTSCDNIPCSSMRDRELFAVRNALFAEWGKREFRRQSKVGQ